MQGRSLRYKEKGLYMNVNLAISKSGHDKNSIYVIIKEEADMYYLADGKYKLLEKPKKKNKKHIQIIKNLPKNITGHFLDEADWSDETVKCALNEYAASINK